MQEVKTPLTLPQIKPIYKTLQYLTTSYQALLLNFKDGRYVYWQDLEKAMASVLITGQAVAGGSITERSDPYGGRKVGGGINGVLELMGCLPTGQQAFNQRNVVQAVWNKIVTGVMTQVLNNPGQINDIDLTGTCKDS